MGSGHYSLVWWSLGGHPGKAWSRRGTALGELHGGCSPPPPTILPWAGHVEEGHRPASDTVCCGCGCGPVFVCFTFVKME